MCKAPEFHQGTVAIPVFKSLADAGGEVAGIKADRRYAQAEPLKLTVQALKIRERMEIVGGDLR
jgi:hypothetical protein